jgi:aryl-alcohol dehydrogenase-like predicted oxidoreductase
VGSKPILPDLSMQFAGIPGTSVEVSRIALGTWAIGGWMWAPPSRFHLTEAQI